MVFYSLLAKQHYDYQWVIKNKEILTYPSKKCKNHQNPEFGQNDLSIPGKASHKKTTNLGFLLNLRWVGVRRGSRCPTPLKIRNTVTVPFFEMPNVMTQLFSSLFSLKMKFVFNGHNHKGKKLFSFLWAFQV